MNCVLKGNHADGNGGAMFGASAVNSTFNSNLAYNRGGAIYNGHATYCNFKGNIAQNGGTAGEDAGDAMYGGEADSCIFNGDSCVDVDIIQPVFNVTDFVLNYGDGTKLVVNLSSEYMLLEDAKIKIDVYTLSRVFVGTYNALCGGWVVPLNAGSYIAVFNATDFDIDPTEAKIVINRVKSEIKSQAVTTIYNKNKYLIITLKDNKGKPLSGQTVTKKYTAKISFAGGTNYLVSSTTAKVVVKKAIPKMTAKKKTFKLKVKTKKYTITLKNNVKKPIKGAKITLKVNKKIFKAKTNKKGKAVFKIKNLKKKGTYRAVIKFAGDKYYKKVTKKVKIRVKK